MVREGGGGGSVREGGGGGSSSAFFAGAPFTGTDTSENHELASIIAQTAFVVAEVVAITLPICVHVRTARTLAGLRAQARGDEVDYKDGGVLILQLLLCDTGLVEELPPLGRDVHQLCREDERKL